MFLKSFIPSKWEESSTLWNDLDCVWGSTIIRSFERCWKSAQHQTKWFFNAAKWAGPWQGMLGSAAQPSTWMFNIQTKWFFNTVKRTGPCLGEHNQAMSSSVFEKLHAIQIKKVVNTVKWVGPCLGEHDQPFIWTLLSVCTTTKRNESSTPRNELGRDRGCWGARPSHQLECFYMAA